MGAEPEANGTEAVIVAPVVDVDAGDAGDAGVEAAAVAEAPDSGWNGEMASLVSEEWFSKLPSEVASSVTAGLQAKHTAWERGFRPKMEANAAREKELAGWQDRLAADEKRWWSIIRGEEDPTTALKKEADDAKAALEEARAALTEAKAVGVAMPDEAVQAKLVAAEAEVAQLRAATTAAWEAESEAAGNDLFDWLGSEHPTIVADGNEAAFNYYGKLIAAEMGAEEAADLVYVKFPNLKPPVPQPVEPAVARMAVAGTGAGGVDGGVVDYWTKISEMRRDAKD